MFAEVGPSGLLRLLELLEGRGPSIDLLVTLRKITNPCHSVSERTSKGEFPTVPSADRVVNKVNAWSSRSDVRHTNLSIVYPAYERAL